MGYRRVTFAPDHVYHIFNRGVEKRTIFNDDHDRERLRTLFFYCLPRGPITSYSLAKQLKTKRRPSASLKLPHTPQGQGLVDVLCFCLMNNHFHLLLRENTEQGISRYMQRVTNSYVRYFNVHYERTGPLFAGRFRAVEVVGDDQVLHVSRYIHLNPFVAHLVDNPIDYPWSSLSDYTGLAKRTVSHTKLLSSMIGPAEYKKFMEDYAGYARDLADISHLAIDL